MPQPRHAVYGSLDCIVVDGGPRPSIATMMCHGYGAPGTDLVGLSFEWISLLGEDAKEFRFVFPAAPHTLDELGMPDGRAWWPINMMQLAELMQMDRFSELHDTQPPGIDEARGVLCQAITELRADLGDQFRALCLGGFSQGAMLTLDTALRGNLDPLPSLLMLFSGTLVCQKQWSESLSRLSSAYVYQAHGTVDPILPHASAKALAALFQNGLVTSEFHEFHGPHTIDTESIARTAQLLLALANNELKR